MSNEIDQEAVEAKLQDPCWKSEFVLKNAPDKLENSSARFNKHYQNCKAKAEAALQSAQQQQKEALEAYNSAIEMGTTKINFDGWAMQNYPSYMAAVDPLNDLINELWDITRRDGTILEGPTFNDAQNSM